ncbi:dirigent protein 23-like [Chenopodium quinoa]|uniref:dirigent protein 23-like n=1 Tax=Chenopodium quinoa TaxID=63459 RepID=UPI000B7934E8|nr:dirigent protein 23-like [Chenopodium quinoa]
MKLIFVILKYLIFTSYVEKLGLGRADWPKTSTWAKTEPYSHHEHKTVLQFYFHEIAIGNSSTVALIAQAQPVDPNNSFAFGNLYMVDELLTVGPDPKSKFIGRAQGFSGSASQQGVNSFMGLCYSFIDGIYNGSSINILGRNSILNPIREIPVVGGTGLFRMARGYAIAQTYYFNVTSGIVVVGYNVTVVHQ